MEPILEGASPIREAIESKSRELGVQITFDIENKTAEEKENIYRETLKFLESLNDEEKTKLAEVAGEMMAINIEGIEDLEYLTVKVRPGAEETMPTPVPAPAPTPASTSEIEVKPKEQNGNGKTDSHIALDAMKIVNEYMGGGVNEARTPNFTALNIDQKNSVYNLVIGLPKLLSYNPKASDWLRGKLFLAGEPGVSYENGQLKIGPGATANGVVNFIKGQISNPSPDIAPTPTPTPTPPILEPITVESEVVLGDTKEPEKEPVYDVPLMQASAGDMVMGEPGWGGPLKIMSKSIDPSNPHFYLGDDSEPRKFLIRGEDINRYRATRKKQTSVEGSQPAPPTPEPVPIPSGTESQEDNPVDVLKKMGFEVDFPARRNRTTHTYEEIEGDPNWAKNVVEALKILGVSSSDQIEINRIIVGSDTIFYSSSNFNSQKRLFVSADLDPQELANFIKFAVDKFKETNSTVGFYMYEDQKKLNQENSEPALTPEPTQPFVPVVQEKINKQPSNWAELNNLLGDLGIELELNEEHLAKFEGKNTAEEKYKEIKEAIASFPNKNVLKEKFNTIRLVYPEFLKNNPKISIRDNILYMDLGISKQEITDFLNNTFGSDVAPAPTPTPTPTPEPVPTTPEPIAVTPEKSLDEEWLEFVKLRDDLAKTEALKRNYSGDTGISVEDLKAKYISDKEKIASLTRRNAYVRFGFGEGPLTREQETSLNDYLFEELVKKENDVYLNALKEARGERLVDKVWEGAKSLLSTKAVKWYLGLSRKERIACSFVLGTAAGLTFGAGVGAFGVVGYVGKRVLTGSAGIGMGELVNKKKSWSAEEIKRKEDEETEALKNSNFSLEEKSKQLTEIQKKYKKERLKAAAWKVGLTATAGAGTGLLANLAEGAFAGTGGSLTENKLPGRKGFEPVDKPKTSSVFEQKEPIKSDIPEQVQKTTPPEPELPKDPIVPKSVEPVSPEGVEQASATTELFDKPEVFKHTTEAGNSGWGLLKETWENNEQFSKLRSGQKTFVLSTFTNKFMEDPTQYGANADGGLSVGKPIDFSKLFEDQKWAKSVLEKAEQLPDTRIKLIEAQDEKILSWVKAHPNEALNEDKVAEILATKPKVVTLNEEMYGDELGTLGGTPEVPSQETYTEAPETGLSDQELEKIPESVIEAPPEFPKSPELDIPNQIPNDFGGDRVLAGGVAVAGMAAMGAVGGKQREELHKEIGEARARLSQLKNERNPNLERTLRSDLNSAMGVNESASDPNKSFKKGIDDIYGEKSFFGRKKREGVDTDKWKEVDGLLAKELIQYDKGESERTRLSPKTLKTLESKENQKFIKELVHLVRETNGVVTPRENEHPGEFMVRLIDFIVKEQQKLENLKKAA